MKQPKALTRPRRSSATTPSVSPTPSPETPPLPDPHLWLLGESTPGVVAARDLAVENGIPPLALVGFVFDLVDPIVPPAFTRAPAAQDAIRQAKSGQQAIQVGVDTRDRLLQFLLPLAYQLDGREPPLLISNENLEPSLVRILRACVNPRELPVIIIANRRLSVKGIPVNVLIRPTLSPLV